MSRACSVSAKRIYGKARVCQLWSVARSVNTDTKCPPFTGLRCPVFNDLYLADQAA